jgi:hypothetical protein
MEDNTNNSGADVNNDIDTEQEGADSQNSNVDNDGEGADGADDKGEKDDGSGDGDGDKDKSDDKKDKTNPDEDEEPKTRKRNIDFILERKNNKIAKLADKANKGNNDKDDDGDEIDPEDENLIAKVVDRKLKPLIDKQIAEEDENEINSFLKVNPEFEKYAGKVRKFAQHELRKNIPIESLFYEVAGKDLMKIGAEKERKATKEAKDTTAGGGNNRNNAGGSKDIWSMTPEEFTAEQARIRSTPRD